MKKNPIIVLFAVVILTLTFSGCIETPSETKPVETEKEEPVIEIPDPSIVDVTVKIINDGEKNDWHWLYNKNGGYIAQSFTPTETFVLTSFEVYLKVTEKADLIIQLQHTTSGKPNGQIINYRVIDSSDLINGWNTANFDSIVLKEDVTYAFVIGMPEMNNIGPVRVYSNNDFNSGQGFYGDSLTNTIWYNQNDEDYLFKIWGY